MGDGTKLDDAKFRYNRCKDITLSSEMPATKHTRSKQKLQSKMPQAEPTTLQDMLSCDIRKIPQPYHASCVTFKQTTAERLQPRKNVSIESQVKLAKPLTQLWCHTPEYKESDSHSSRSRADLLLLERVLRDLISSPPFANRKRSFSPKRLMRNSVLPIPMPSKV